MSEVSVKSLGVTVDGAPVLADVTFEIRAGQRLAVIGETGSGKSVLLRTVAGLPPAGSKVTGTIEIKQSNPAPENEALAKPAPPRVGVILQNAGDAFDPLQTVGSQIAEGLVQVPGDQPKVTPEDALREVGLDPKLAGSLPGDLTIGERQLAVIAAALAPRPDLLVADDPFAGLDPIAQRRVVELIDRLSVERAMSVLLVSHDLKVVALLATRLAVLKAGRIVETGERQDVLGHPRHALTRQVMSSGRHRARTLMRTPIGGTLLEVRGLSRRYRQPDRSLFEPRPPVVALDGVSFIIRQAESLGVIGPAGAGKSTLARIIVGLEQASGGELEFDHAVYHGPDLPRTHRSGISFVPHDPVAGFDPRLTVGESIAEPLQLEPHQSLDDLAAQIVEIVTALGLSADMLGHLPRDFAVGELQRFAIARALVARPQLIVMDEPVSALDIASRGEMVVMLNRLRADFGLTFMVISHDLELIRIVSDRVMVMDQGKVVEITTPAQLLGTPQHEMSRRLAAAALPDVGIVPVF